MAGPRTCKVAVIGAGVGGLVCAIDLAASGHRVVVLERAAASGGKARITQVAGTNIDAGPTVLTMPWVFDELFQSVGRSFRDEAGLEKASLLARHFWSDGTTLDLHADRERSADAIGRVFGAAESKSYLAFCEDGRRIFEIAEGPFLRSPRPTMASIVRDFGAVGLTAFARIDSHRSMWRALEQRFLSPKLRQLFGRYATYCGSSPFEAPATLNLVAHVEAEGVYRARGGMRGLVAALERLAISVGVEIRHQHDVARIVVERGRAIGVVACETFYDADAVVFNGDISALSAGLLGSQSLSATGAIALADRSLSAVTWAMVAQPTGLSLKHHNVFFSDAYADEFDAILRRGRTPSHPTVYICAQDRDDVDVPASSERLLALVNAPATGDDTERWKQPERDQCTVAMMSTLRRAGLTVAPLEHVQTTPADFDQMFPGTGGALYGPRSKGALSALSRHGATSKLPGLYLAGGSVHPGPGVPMAALSGRLAAASVNKDLASIGRCRRAGTTGITSTR